MLPVEERESPDTVNPMCEVFPKMASCRYHRYGMGGGIDNRHAICILGLNMINDKVFLFIWIWFCLLIFLGGLRLITRSFQLCSSKVRYFLVYVKMDRYFKKNAHMKHIQHYLNNCSIGDWFVLYQLSKNVNKRFFAEFLALIALVIDPDPSLELEEPEIYLSQKDIETFKSGVLLSSEHDKSESNDNEGADDNDDAEGGGRFQNIEGMDTELDTRLDGGRGDGLSGKQRMLIKQGKSAKSASRDAMKAQQAIRRMKR